VDATEEAIKHLFQVVQQMPAIRHLAGFRGSFPSPSSIFATAVTGNDLYTRMRLQPCPECLGRTIPTPFDGVVLLQVQ
jgi:hypothetical protein